MKLYLPSNGTEGAIFMDRWCDRCAKENWSEETRDGGCDILTTSFFEYVPEWVYGEDGVPYCKEFVKREEE